MNKLKNDFSNKEINNMIYSLTEVTYNISYCRWENFLYDDLLDIFWRSMVSKYN